MFPLMGVLLLLLLLVDVFRTVFQPHGHGGPLSRRQNHLVWNVFRSTGLRRDGTVRAGWLALAGPVLAVLTPLLWVVLLVAGFALVYYPWVSHFRVSSGGERIPWVQAIYYSGSTATTLGPGDVAARVPALRLVTVVEAFSGFALITASLSYVLAVYREMGIVSTLARAISVHFPDGASRLPRRADAPHLDAWGRWLGSIGEQLLHVHQALSQYPILHYFRVADRDESLPVQLGALLVLRRQLGANGAADGDGLASHPGWLSLRAALEVLLNGVEDSFVPARVEAAGALPDADSTERAYAKLLRYMGYGDEGRWQGGRD